MASKNLSFIFFIFVFFFKNSFCMQEKQEQEKQVCDEVVEKCEKECEKCEQDGEKKITRGEVVLGTLANLVKNKESQEERDKVVRVVARNIIEFGVHKAINSMDDLVMELKKLPLLGPLIVQIGFAEYCSGYVANIQKEKEDIKVEMAKTLGKELEKRELENKDLECGDSFVLPGEAREVPWSEHEITNSHFVDEKEPETALDLICLGNRIAINNKEFLYYFLKKAQIPDLCWTLHYLLHFALSHNKVAPYIEDALERRYLPGKFLKDKEPEKIS